MHGNEGASSPKEPKTTGVSNWSMFFNKYSRGLLSTPPSSDAGSDSPSSGDYSTSEGTIRHGGPLMNRGMGFRSMDQFIRHISLGE